jgi:hypothetical protein
VLEVAAQLHSQLVANLAQQVEPSIEEGKISYQQLMKLLDGEEEAQKEKQEEEAAQEAPAALMERSALADLSQEEPTLEEIAQMIKAKLPTIQRTARIILSSSRLFWIIPLLCLLPILFFQVDSFQSLGYWVGVRLSIATLIIFLIRFGLSGMLKRAAVKNSRSEEDPLVQMLLTELKRWWLGPLQRQGAIMLAVSLVLLALAFVLPVVTTR